ncbi:MAG: hypothetical protein K9L85_02425 [Candidatus Peribacteraceae bacterium]|nr:hypothetical protein [Candidatus Peribacteraceae bacterium]
MAEALKQAPPVRNSLEKKMQETLLPTLIKVESFVLDEFGSKHKINFLLWDDAEKAKQDLKVVFEKYPKLKSFFDGLKPAQKTEFTKILRSRLVERANQKKTYREQLRALSEETETSVFDYAENGLNKIQEYWEEGPAGYAKIVGVGVLFYGIYRFGIKPLLKGFASLFDEGKPKFAKFLAGGGVAAGAIYLATKFLKPKNAEAKEIDVKPSLPLKIDAQKTPNKEAQKIQAIIDTSPGAKAMLGLMDVPVAAILQAYTNSDPKEQSINPKFLERFVSEKERFPRKWMKRMLKKIDAHALFQVIHSTIELFRHSPSYKKTQAIKNKTGEVYSVLDYIREEYVQKSGATTIEFVELMALALEEQHLQQWEIDPAVFATKKEEIMKIIGEATGQVGETARSLVGAVTYQGLNTIGVTLKTGAQVVWDFAGGVWRSIVGGTEKKFKKFEDAWKEISK